MKAPVRHVNHAETVFGTTLDSLGHEHDFIERHRCGVWMPKENHAPAVRHAENVNTASVCNDRGPILVNSHLNNRLAAFLFLLQSWDRELSPLLWFRHWLLQVRSSGREHRECRETRSRRNASPAIKAQRRWHRRLHVP